MMNQPGLTKTFIAATAVARYSVVALDAADDSVKLATDVGDSLIGISAEPADVSAGERIDVHFCGIVKVKAGAAVAKGAWLTVDASGRVVTSAAETDERIGKALSAAAAADDVISVEILKSQG